MTLFNRLREDCHSVFDANRAVAYLHCHDYLATNPMQAYQVASTYLLYGSDEIASGGIITLDHPDAWALDEFGSLVQRHEQDLLRRWI